MAKKNKQTGRWGESVALKFFIKKKFKLLERNFHCRWGEIDLILKKGNKIHFVEVKTRQSESKGKPYEAVNYYKLKSLKNAINYYILKNHLTNFKLSLDVVSIQTDSKKNIISFDYFENCLY